MPKIRDRSGRSRTTDPATPSARAGRTELAVMSFNLRYDASAPAGDPDRWADRAPLVARLLGAERPTVLGVQEPLFHQLAVVSAALPGYAAVGFGREGGSRSEHSSVFYDTNRLRLTGWDQRWLSDTPKVIGSRTWANDLPRILVRCDFTDLATGTMFAMINTHLDHRSEQAQRRGTEQIVRELAGTDRPVIVTGDFNCAAGDSAPWRVLVDAGLVDSWLVAAQRDSPDTATWHGYDAPRPGGPRIDWIMVSPDVEVRSAKINTWTDAGRWPSDHCPVQAGLVIGGAAAG